MPNEHVERIEQVVPELSDTCLADRVAGSAIAMNR